MTKALIKVACAFLIIVGAFASVYLLYYMVVGMLTWILGIFVIPAAAFALLWLIIKMRK
ncbi:hypothetical protein [Streptomyces cupreus]|uniref:Uncharacterized protein n=1 Tax=Streptomyces cupreus TaxID=2759956 RepID=A0A7X1JC82_9ACTN|nr:hypothetical protein [Streptomyces cupreus]MBC2907594.1 hypothetical protein [Streptomyces cupreus]